MNDLERICAYVHDAYRRSRSRRGGARQVAATMMELYGKEARARILVLAGGADPARAVGLAERSLDRRRGARDQRESVAPTRARAC